MQKNLKICIIFQDFYADSGWSTNKSLPFLEYDDFGVSTVLAVFADENVVFVAGDSETAALFAIFCTNLFDLVSPVAGVVVKELDGVAIDVVFLIDERALQYEEVIDAGHVLDTEGVDFFDEFLLHGRSGVRQLISRKTPALERREILAKFHLVFIASKALAGILVEFVHELRAEFHHFFHGEVARERAVFVAVNAVFLVLTAVGIRTENFVSERHTAALTEFHFHKFSFFNIFANRIFDKLYCFLMPG